MQINIDTAQERAKIESEISSLQNRLAAIDLIEQGFVGSASNGNAKAQLGYERASTRKRMAEKYLPIVVEALRGSPGASAKEICSAVYGRVSKKNIGRLAGTIKENRGMFVCKGRSSKARWYLADQPC